MSSAAPRQPRLSTDAKRRAALAGWPGGLALLLLCAAVYLPGLVALPPIDRDEPRFAQASRQMLHGRTPADWIVPRVQDTPRLKKPPLIYWLQALSVSVFGDESKPGGMPSAGGGIWAYRVPSVLAAIVAVLITWRLGLAMFHPAAAWLGAAMLGSCWVVVFDAHLARADELLLACTLLTQWALWHIWRGARHATRPGLRWPLLFWFGVSLGTLAKGPVTPAIAAMTIAAICISTRRWRWLARLRPAAGMLLVFALVAPWCFLMGQAVGWETFAQAVTDEVVNRSTGAKEGHFGPPGYHLLLMPLLFWPGSLLAIAAVQRSWRVARRRPAETFLLAWLLPGWLAFELVMTKLPHYTLPLYPALALLTGRAVCAAASGALRLPTNWGVRTGMSTWIAIGVLSAVAAPLALVWWTRATMPSSTIAMAVIIAVAILALLFGAIRALQRRNLLIAQVYGVVATVGGATLVLQIVLPACAPLWLPSRAVAAIHERDPAGNRPLAAVGYFEDSLVFLTRGRVQRVEFEQLSAWFTANPDGLVLASDGTPLGDATQVAAVDGFNYSNGRHVRLRLLERR